MFDLHSQVISEGTINTFVDKRLEKRYDKIMAKLETGQSSIMNKINISRKERKGAYDFFQNPRVSELALKTQSYERLKREFIGLSAEHVLVLGDTTEYNYLWNENHIRDKKGLGTLSNESSLGFNAHVSIALRESDLSVIGLSDIQIWHREADRPPSSTRKQRVFEKKESYKWHVGILNSNQRLPRAELVTYIQDRDGDIYESIVKIQEMESTELLVRSCRDRKIELPDGQRVMLYDYLSKQEALLEYEFKVRGDRRQGRTARVAKMEVYCCRVNLVCPANFKKDQYPPTVEVNVVWAKEKQETVPTGETPIDWKLITTHQVIGSEELIKKIIQWYKNRWIIEEFFLSQSQEPTTWRMPYWRRDMAYAN